MKMKSNLHEFSSQDVEVLFADIDGTMTTKGKLPADVYEALWQLQAAGIKVIPVTGRPAGWCEMIVRLWPVHAVIGENGAFYFQYEEAGASSSKSAAKKAKRSSRNSAQMKRVFAQSTADRKSGRVGLKKILQRIREEVPAARLSSDQFCRISDLAIDFCEDIPRLSDAEIDRIKEIFEEEGAVAKISSIHVNGWFGDFDKLSMCKMYVANEMKWASPSTGKSRIDLDSAKFLAELQKRCAFVGDSPNDEPMFAFFKNSIAVANISEFWNQLKHKPRYVSAKPEGFGFCELAKKLLSKKTNSDF